MNNPLQPDWHPKSDAVLRDQLVAYDEMRVVMEELLGRTTRIHAIPSNPPIKAVYPASGFATLPLRLESAR